jgi:hypothetical protein
MKRRSFLKLLGAVPAVAACPALAVEPVKKFTEANMVEALSAMPKGSSLAAKGVQIWAGDLLARNEDGEIVRATMNDHIIGIAGNTACESIPITVISESTILAAS